MTTEPTEPTDPARPSGRLPLPPSYGSYPTPPPGYGPPSGVTPYGPALRDIVGTIATGILSIITGLISFILFVSRADHRSLADLIGGTIVVHDPNKVLG